MDKWMFGRNCSLISEQISMKFSTHVEHSLEEHISYLLLFFLFTRGRSRRQKLIYSIFIISDVQSYEVTKDLLQHISNGRTQIQAFGSINVDMSLPPTFIMLFTSYTVIALQFNNVL